MKPPLPTPSPVGIIGAGRWGERLIRIAYRHGIPVHAYDPDPTCKRKITRTYPNLTFYESSQALLSNPAIKSVIIATPPASHYRIAMEALRHDKHVLLEKPMTLTVRHARSIVGLAAKRKRVLMVDHTYLFSPAVTRLIRDVQTGKLGQVRLIRSIRGIGRIHPESSVLWDLAPHDISISMALLGNGARSAQAFGVTWNGQRTDCMYAVAFEASTLLGSLSWSTPVKTRTMDIIGEQGAVSITFENGTETVSHFRRVSGESYALRKRHTERPSPEPLEHMLMHFFACVSRGMTPRSDGSLGLAVVQCIAALSASAERNGARIRV